MTSLQLLAEENAGQFSCYQLHRMIDGPLFYQSLYRAK